MKPSQIAQIILRLFSLSWFLYGLVNIVYNYSAFLAGKFSAPQWVLLAPGLATLILAVLLWLAAPKIGKLIAQGNDQECCATSISFHQLLVAMFVGLGVYFCLSSFGAIFNWIHFLAMEQAAPKAIPDGMSRSYYSLTQEALTFAAGLFVIFTAQKWALKISKQ